MDNFNLFSVVLLNGVFDFIMITILYQNVYNLYI